ncbi:hypothetical protein AMS68_004292 [Peltaster fructicola]|uniref:Protein PBN1 n=1 Tax=Peltaster fructicola TaxID=286661 RepID=A0A6H0XVU1_9PEZI|nr:hypothetical protein AMS68_004292 [Peltaster fructicola]
MIFERTEVPSSPSSMKQRFTFLLPEGSFIDIKNINVADGIFNFTNPPGYAGVERRTTLSLSELPKTLRSHLKYIHELHLRWIRTTEYPHLVPLVSRQPPGLHVFFTPRVGSNGDEICSSLRWLLNDDVKCETTAESFNRPAILSDRFATSATYQFFQQQPSLDGLVEHLTKFCGDLPNDHLISCQTHIKTISTATEVNLDFDAISHALVITAIWPQEARGSKTSIAGLSEEASVHAHGRLDANEHDGTIEIGVLSAEQADEREELKLGGYLVVLGEDKKPSATLFSFPSRHHPLPAHDKTVYKAAFIQPTGLHPKLSVTFLSQRPKPPHETCALHAYLTLPSALFLDRYQLSEPELLASHNLRALRALSGAEDLEAPDWAIKQWGSASLFELVRPDTTRDTWEALIPLHLRYLQTHSNLSSRQLETSWPIVFWACEAEEGLKMNTNPFDRVNLGYDGLFGPKTMFYHIPPAQSDLTSTLIVPTLHPETASWLAPSTLAVVLAGLLWVLWSLARPLKRNIRVVKTD